MFRLFLRLLPISIAAYLYADSMAVLFGKSAEWSATLQWAVYLASVYLLYPWWSNKSAADKAAQRGDEE